MNCSEFRSAVLAGDETVATSDHSRSCAACQSHTSELRAAREALADRIVWEEPSPELGRQVESLIGNASGRTGSTGTVGGPPWTRIGAVAAAVLVVMFLGVYAVTGSNAPDWEVAVPGTDLAPSATAIVSGWNTQAGTRMVVEIDGLARAPAGYMYEFWLSNGPIHISAGTFRSPGDVELWSGVARAAFPRLWITLEPIDEDESPSGQTVLDTGNSDV